MSRTIKSCKSLKSRIDYNFQVLVASSTFIENMLGSLVSGIGFQASISMR